MKLHFSYHAFDRVKERLSLSPDETMEIIEKEKTIPIGIESSSNRSHDLFFSIPDNKCFVSVKDINDGTIITIVPVEWHNRWVISPEAMTAAKDIATGKSKGMFNNERPSRLKVTGKIEWRSVNLGSLEMSEFPDANAAASSEKALTIISDKMKLKGYTIDDFDVVTINNGGSSEAIRFDVYSLHEKLLLRKTINNWSTK